MKPENKNHRIIAIIFISILTSGISGGGVYYFLNQQNKAQEDLIDELGKDSIPKDTSDTNAEKASSKLEVPDDFDKIKLNGATVYYPEDWGTPKLDKSEEDVPGEGPAPSFKGENATFGDWDAAFYVNNVDSYEKSEFALDTVTYLKKVYKERTASTEELYVDAKYIPLVNAGTTPYNPRYVESDNGKWRGYWFLANQGQAVSSEVVFVSILYNKDEDKVATIRRVISSEESLKLENELFSAPNDSDYQLMPLKIEAYMKSAYATDNEVKKAVDNECLKVVKLLN